jgi:hypothetical protein
LLRQGGAGGESERSGGDGRLGESGWVCGASEGERERG